jgi:hypothetical protein
MATPKSKSQIDKFKQAARDHEADEDEKRFNEKLEKIARQKPKPDNATKE